MITHIGLFPFTTASESLQMSPFLIAGLIFNAIPSFPSRDLLINCRCWLINIFPSFFTWSAKLTRLFSEADAEFEMVSAVDTGAEFPETVRGIKFSASWQRDFKIVVERGNETCWLLARFVVQEGAGGGGGDDRRDKAAKLVESFGEVIVVMVEELVFDCRLLSNIVFLVVG